MSYRNKTYVAFDGDTDMWAYRIMQAWKEHDHIDFNFYNAHDINSARDTSTVESIKAQLRERMASAKQVIPLVGKKTRDNRGYIPWEIELARKKDIPIIVSNLNEKRTYDADLCPTALGIVAYTVHIAFKMKIIQFALDNFPDDYDKNKDSKIGNYRYPESVYEKLGL